MTLHSLPIFVRLKARAVILIGTGEAAEAKRRLLERAGASIVGEDGEAALAIVVDDVAAVARLKARGVLVNAVDRPDLCDFTLPAIAERGPVIIAIGTGGASAGLAAALRQRIEGWLPVNIGRLATSLQDAREGIRARWPATDERRRAIGDALAPGGALDPFGSPDVDRWLVEPASAPKDRTITLSLTSGDPDDLTLRQARLLGLADRICHTADVPAAILQRARADAERISGAPPAGMLPGLTLVLEMVG